ncbi:MAG: DEAD/DEAH box helicase [Saezia sp.]
MSESFFNLALADSLQKAIADMGYTEMTPIQAKAIPIVLQGRDVMGAAQTGTGKTAAFSLPLLQKMLQHENTSASPARHPVRALVLLPTRELADQVAHAVVDYSKYTKLKTACVFGGIDIKPQAAELKAGVEILIATPGRLLDHIEARNCVLNQVEYVVLDEADRMLDIGFLPDLERILAYLPKKRQTLLFSATFSNDIKRLAKSYLQEPELIEVASPNAAATNIEQRMVQVSDNNKRDALVKLIQDNKIEQAIVFTNSRLATSRLARTLERSGFSVAALHGDKTQDERLKALDALKENKIQLLIATDVAARGLDVVDLPAVFNYDLPFNAEDYVHRIGRTGRAGAKGIAISLVDPGQNRLLHDIEKLLKRKFVVESIVLGGAADFVKERRFERQEPESKKPAENLNPAVHRERRETKRRADDPNISYSQPRNLRYDPIFAKPYDEARGAKNAAAREQERSLAQQSTPFSRYKEQKKGALAVLLGGSGKN